MPAKSSAQKKYGSKASQKVKDAMHEMKRGKLKSGRSGKTVKSKKQASRLACGSAPKWRQSSCKEESKIIDIQNTDLCHGF
jgi:hypothetical protein